jgi:hypothetical protein
MTTTVVIETTEYTLEIADVGVQGPAGLPGADSTVPGPQGPAGPAVAMAMVLGG